MSDDSSTADIPTAEVVQSSKPWHRRLSLMWVVTGACFVLAIGLVIYAYAQRGPRITVSFDQGHGIQVGDPLRFRGIVVGEVTNISLNDSVDGVLVEIELQPTAAELAREGSQFWIERPQVSLSRISGLDTVVGGKYVAVVPGPTGAAPRDQFEGLKNPLGLTESSDAIRIAIKFHEGNGLSVGDVVKHRGIDVGEVTAVDLEDDLSRVRVEVRLSESGRPMARQGTRFWIERPTVSVAEIRGLDTIVSGRYIAVDPGAAESPRQTEFIGLDEAPAGELAAGGLQITLRSPHIGGLGRGAPITHRGVRVGRVVSVGLATDSANVHAQAFIDPAYVGLIRTNTQFWKTGGIDWSFGFSGVRLDTDSLSSLAYGGVSFATKTPPGDKVRTGESFKLLDKPPDDWVEWQPRIPVGAQLLPGGASLPQPVRASLSWQKRSFGITRDRQRQGWVMLLEGSRLLGPADLLSVSEENAQNIALEVAGKSVTMPEKGVDSDTDSKLATLGDVDLNEVEPWPADRIRTPEMPEDCLIVGATEDLLLPLPATRLQQDAGAWRIDDATTLDVAHYHGASVIGIQDGALIGIVIIGDDESTIAPIQERLK